MLVLKIRTDREDVAIEAPDGTPLGAIRLFRTQRRSARIGIDLPLGYWISRQPTRRRQRCLSGSAA